MRYDPRTDKDARAKWYRAWTTIRAMGAENRDIPDYMFSEEYLFEYLAGLRILGRFTPGYYDDPAPKRLAVRKLIDSILKELKS